MAINIYVEPSGIEGWSDVLATDNLQNIYEFTSDLEFTQNDFKFNVKIKIGGAIIYDRLLQNGFINVYPILKTANVRDLLQVNNGDIATIDNQDLQTVKYEIEITETWVDSSGDRVNGATWSKVNAIHKSLYPNGRYDKDISRLFYNVYFKNPVGKGGVIVTQTGTTKNISQIEAVIETNNSEYKTSTAQSDTANYIPLVATSKEFESDGDYLKAYIQDGANKISKTKEYYFDNCVENHIVTWRNKMGMLESFNFAHSGIKSGKITEQRYYTNISKRAYTDTTKFIDVSTLYITEEVYSYLLEILQSTEVYYNMLPVIPSDLSYSKQHERFEELINLTIRLEFAEQENGILR